MINNINFWIKKEKERQSKGFNLIASENICPLAIRKLEASILGNKYAEGNISNRFYSGCKFVDEIEKIAIENCCKLFDSEYANVQLHSGTQANFAAINAFINPGDTILSMDFSAGGHLSHGHPLSLISKLYKIETYNLNKETELIDYDELEKKAKLLKPKLIISGASSYSKIINYKKINEIAKEVNAFHLIDIAHIAGLIAGKEIENPINYADVITSTTHKTLRGPRGAFILSHDKYKDKINRSVMPGVQGGPFMNVIAAKALTFSYAMTDEFKDYSKKVIYNSKLICDIFKKNGFKIISNGTDTHLFLIDLISSLNINGKIAEEELEKENIFVNRNSIPFDKLSPRITSGIRIGTAFITSQNLKENKIINKTKKIINILKNIQ
jgi:glycine hydroxymethyltransferase